MVLNMNERALKVIQTYIKRGREHSDMVIFKQYCRGELSAHDAKKKWLENNSVPYEDGIFISDDDFKEWLRTIGWVKFA